MRSDVTALELACLLAVGAGWAAHPRHAAGRAHAIRDESKVAHESVALSGSDAAHGAKSTEHHERRADKAGSLIDDFDCRAVHAWGAAISVAAEGDVVETVQDASCLPLLHNVLVLGVPRHNVLQSEP